MAITAKCDVYSFGVVALETLMGRHPGELLSSLSSPSSSSRFQNIMISEVLDHRLPEPKNRLVARDVVLVAILALACLNDKPKFRPTMKQVSQILSRKGLLAKRLNDISLGQLMIPETFLDDETKIVTINGLESSDA